MSPSKSLPIDLFGDDELTSAYIAWQEHCGKTENTGSIAFVADYVNFCIDKNPRNFNGPTSASTQHIATKCGHILHPSRPDDCDYCPLCIVIAYLNLLGLVASAWDQIGGPWQARADPGHAQRFGLFRIMWTRFRLELAQLTTDLEEQARQEALWAVDHPEAGNEIALAQSATNGVVVAQTMTRYPTVGTLGQEGLGSTTKLRAPWVESPPERQKKTVRFGTTATVITDAAAAGTGGTLRDRDRNQDALQASLPIEFESGRYIDFWARDDPDYEPGKYAAPTSRGWVDTSFAGDALYNLRQLKVYTNSSQSQVDQIGVGNHPVESEGLACGHRYWGEIQAAICAALDDGRLSTQVLAEADCLLVSARDDVFNDVALHSSSDKLTYAQNAFRAEKWTSELETMIPT